MKAKKLIEVAMPIKEISAESVRDKSIRHGHISTLHLWWARRLLPTCRAVVFASLVPDPLDPNCPQAFRDAVRELLCTGIEKLTYAPYPDIPYTAIFDPMEDNLRNRLLMFIGKFSDKCQANMIVGKSTPPKDQLQEGCLIKWESKNDEAVLTRARKLIWVAYNSEKNLEAEYQKLSQEYDEAWESIKDAENKLYSYPNRHIESDEVKAMEAALKDTIECFQSRMPSVFDPFAGGGAIPLEAARLGCRSYGNDINPVAHIIEKGSAEFPQKYGKPITYTRDEFMRLYGEEGIKLLQSREISFMNDEVTIPNRLAFDVEYYGRKLISMTEKEVGYLYPDDEKGNKLVAYYWTRTAKCSNPSCGAEIPLLKQFYLCNTPKKKYWLRPIINGINIEFKITKGVCGIKDGFVKNRNLICPCCGSTTSESQLITDFKERKISLRPIAKIIDTVNGKEYVEINSSVGIEESHDSSSIDFLEKPMQAKNTKNFSPPRWGLYNWKDLYSSRQLLMLGKFINNLDNVLSANSSEYYDIVRTFLAILVDKLALLNTSFGRWHNGRETVEHPYSRQAIPMMFDFPETNPFSGVTGSSYNHLEWIVRYLDEESFFPFTVEVRNASSGEQHQFEEKSITAVVTDPPYYNAIAYADISDFFYCWLKETIGSIYPVSFGTPQTPKAEECTALSHHHNGDYELAKDHFENKLLEVFKAIELQTSDVVSIMFAHQTTEAWTTLCNSILGAKMNIQGSWTMDTEMVNRSIGLSGDALESSVTVACTPSERKGYGSYKKVKRAIQDKVAEEVKTLYELGFRGADLLTACFGKAVSEFGNYEHVEKADGSEVSVAELLELARTAAFTALIRDFASDDYTKFYIGWLQLNGMGESDYDDATKFTRAGMSVNISDIFAHNLLVKNEGSNKQHLGTFRERAHEGLMIPEVETPLIDKVHHAMLYWANESTGLLHRLIAAYGEDINNEFWRVLHVLKELLPECDDRNQVMGLLNNAESLIKRSKTTITAQPEQGSLFDDDEL